MACDAIDPLRGRCAVHRLRGVRAHHQYGRRYARPKEDVAARALYCRAPGDRSLSRRVADRDGQSIGRRDRTRQGLRAGRGRQAVPR